MVRDKETGLFTRWTGDSDEAVLRYKYASPEHYLLGDW